MIYDAYLGAVGSIFLLNAVQWALSRDWIYGLFTLQTLVWFTFTSLQALELTESQGSAIHVTTNSVVLISYIELVHRLFDGARTQSLIGRLARWIQLGLAVYLLIDVGLLLTIPTRWLSTPLYTYGSLLYWSTLVVICAAGIQVAARRRNAVGYFFIIGSGLLLLIEAHVLVYFIGKLAGIPVMASPVVREWLGQVIAGGYIIKLLCFSLCLVFRQRQSAVAQAVSQARVEDQLVQERLETELALRRLEQEKTDVQLRALQAQVNPHFLFNSLNSLSSLIDDEPARASQFVNELSVVYRYLLRANDQPLTTLASELDFIQSYYHLLKTRYGNGLSLTIRVGADEQSQRLPPLTLQLLVENAVKHNVTSPKRPLAIDIFTDATGQLTVRNNLQRKQVRVLSNGVGLATITTQYQQLQQPAPVVREAEDYFIITLSLIPSVDNLVKTT